MLDSDLIRSCSFILIGCTCRANWKGIHCADDVDECEDPTICMDTNSYCQNSVGSYQCLCRDGYQKNTSTDICMGE